jgi:hypothetical protein
LKRLAACGIATALTESAPTATTRTMLATSGQAL